MSALACMSSMVVLAPAEFYHRFHGDLFDKVLDGIEELETRTPCLHIMLQFLTDTKVSALKQDMPTFTKQINRLLEIMFDSGRREVRTEEADVYTNLLVQMGVKHVHHVATEVAKSFLDVDAPRSLHSQQVRVISSF